MPLARLEPPDELTADLEIVAGADRREVVAHLVIVLKELERLVKRLSHGQSRKHVLGDALDDGQLREIKAIESSSQFADELIREDTRPRSQDIARTHQVVERARWVRYRRHRRERLMKPVTGEANAQPVAVR